MRLSLGFPIFVKSCLAVLCYVSAKEEMSILKGEEEEEEEKEEEEKEEEGRLNVQFMVLAIGDSTNCHVLADNVQEQDAKPN